MKVKGKQDKKIYNANIKSTGWHIWTVGYYKCCTEEEFKKEYIILL